MILDGGTDHPIHVRFATNEKKLGPEQRFQVEAPRAIALGRSMVGEATRSDHREPVGPLQGARARRGRRPTSRTSGDG